MGQTRAIAREKGIWCLVLTASFLGQAWVRPERDVRGTMDLKTRAFQLWDSTPVIVSHTHVDPDNIPGSIDELIRGGITTAVLNLTLDDGDLNRRADTLQPIDQSDTAWGVRFDARLAVLDSLERAGKIVLVRALSDVPASAADVQQIRSTHRIAIIVASEGSNQLEAPRPTPMDNVAERDTTPKGATTESILKYRSHGWLSTALVHQSGNAGHRFLQRGGGGLNDLGRFAVAALLDAHILVDMPHLNDRLRNEILDIAELGDSPVMISHERPDSVLGTAAGRDEAVRIVQSGHCTGLIGMHSYVTYIQPSNLQRYAAEIDAGRRGLDSLVLPAGQHVDGNRHLALGIDWFFNRTMNLSDWAGRDPSEPLSGLVGLLMNEPYSYSDDQIRNVLGANMLRILGASMAGQVPVPGAACH